MRRALLVLLLVGGCGAPAETPTLDKSTLMKPETCMQCHPNHYTEWSGSMHAYASRDPVFRAMNARGQRETGGKLGPFCVNCHAPMAVKTGATTDGLNLDSLPDELHGVTCFFCHTVDQVTDDHNAPLNLADDWKTMLGGITDPATNNAHHARFSSLHDRQSKASASLCGSCHDIVNPIGTPIERTYREWQGTIYAHDDPKTLRTCGKCHMTGTDNMLAAPGAMGVSLQLRTVHDHSFPGVDVALTPFPQKDAQKAAILGVEDLATALSAKLCVTPAENDTDMALTLDNVAVGHGYPSGANQDRRSWVEIIAYQNGQVVYSSGVVADGQDVTSIHDPDLLLFRDQIFDATGKQVHMFWDAASYMGTQITAAVTNDPNDIRYFQHVVMKTYKAVGQQPDRVTVRLRLLPVGLDVMDDLVASGDLRAGFKSQLPTFDLAGTVIEWQLARDHYGCVP
jgi:hypothetical protein